MLTATHKKTSGIFCNRGLKRERSRFDQFGFQTAHPQNAGGAFRTLFVGANYEQGKQSGRHDSDIRLLGSKPVRDSAYEMRIPL